MITHRINTLNPILKEFKSLCGDVELNIRNSDLFVPDKFDAYIIVSFVNATLVLSIGETVEEVTDSGFLGTTPTLSCSSLADHALVQVIFFAKKKKYLVFNIRL